MSVSSVKLIAGGWSARLTPAGVRCRTAGVQGPAGPAGAAGATGPAGPNLVTGSTATTLSGLLYGNGSVCSAVTVGGGLTLVNGVLAAAVTSVAGRIGAVTLAVADVAGAAPLASPTFTGQVFAPAGSAGAPGVAYAAEANTGFYLRSIGGYTTYVTQGTPRCEFNTVGVRVGGAMGLVGGADITGTGQDVGLFRAAAKVWGVTDGGAAGGTLRSIPLTPAQIAGNQNDYAPGVARFYRLSSDASRTITGLSVGQVDGQECEAWNVGSNPIVLAHQSASSSVANRLICTGAADITLAPDESALLRYDATTQRWRTRKV